METALDVLSMAASMVETNEKNAQDPLYKGLPLVPPPPPHPRDIEHRESVTDHIDARSSPGKELLTKHHKQERLKERLELTTPLNFDKDHALQHQQRQLSTATPTQGHPSSPDHYRNGDSSSLDSFPGHHHHHQMLSSRGSLRTPPSHPPPRYPHHLDLHSQHEGPLNLSLANSSSNANSGNHSPTQSRPSVITCANLVSANGKYETSSNGSASPSQREATEICDPDIEEHFRRSLGKNYPSFMAKHPSVSPSPPPPPQPSVPQRHPSPPPAMPMQQASPVERSPPRCPPTSTQGAKVNPNVSITGSVDDHFARALGDSTWSALKAKSDPAEPPAPGSVDDHFAKALGDTWLRIKAERESPRGPPPPFPPLPPYHQAHTITHPMPRPHSMAHPMAQRPSSPSSQSHSTSLVST